jgi:Mg-chelatase subunit ChlD
MTWAAKRQIIYFSVFLALVIIVIGIPAFAILYHKPTCFDGELNGNEQDVDCGGTCSRLCKAYVTQPVVVWQQSFEVEPGLYSAVAYIQNPNQNAQAKTVPYTFTLRDGANTVVAERKGIAFIPAGKTFAIFESNITVPKKAGPLRTSFIFTGEFDWHAASSTQVSIRNQTLNRITDSPVVTADVSNPGNDLGRVNFTAIVYDSQGNAIAASKTYVEDLKKGAVKHIVFTWPNPFAGQVVSCQQPTDIVLSIDRSGSMTSDGKNPPQPLTTVKEAALSFVNSLALQDKASVISFATQASDPIDQTLTTDRAAAKEAVESITILDSGLQYTNIADALTKSIAELTSSRHQSGAQQAIILLTDGEPTHPQKKGDAHYPKDTALAAARDAQSRGIQVFTIGLGKTVNDDFLKSVAGLDERYFRAPTSDQLETIYATIGSSLCKLGPAKVEIIPDVLPL